MSDLFGNHIVVFSMRRLNYSSIHNNIVLLFFFLDRATSALAYSVFAIGMSGKLTW